MEHLDATCWGLLTPMAPLGLLPFQVPDGLLSLGFHLDVCRPYHEGEAGTDPRRHPRDESQSPADVRM